MSGNAETEPQAITRCPACGTSFRITESQLLAADGSVRCGACFHLFQAEDYFISPMLDVTELLAIQEDYWSDFERYVYQVAPDIEETEPSGTESVQEISEETEVVEFWNPSDKALPSGELEPGEVVGYWQPAPRRLLISITEPEEKRETTAARIWEPEVSPVGFWELPAVPYWDDELPDDVPVLDLEIEHDTEVLLADRRRIVSFAGLKWLPGIAAMVLIGFVQYAYFHMSAYAQNVKYRDYYVTACSYLGCDVPDYANLDELRTRELLIRTHPAEEDALVADVLLLNAAAYRQTFPGLRLRFFDIDGDVVASRTFRVSEYLGGELRGLKYIPARTEVRLSLELVDPGDRALGYEMDVVSM